MEFSSKLVERAVSEIALLPGIGKRSALRLVLHLLRQPKDQAKHLSSAIAEVREHIKYCKSCYNISDVELCDICQNPLRDHNLVCVVEDIRDVMAIESTSQFKGVYHVLGGKISPMDGIGPHDLKIPELIERVKNHEISELIFALSASMEGDTTNFYIYNQLKKFPIKMTSIARGIGVNDEIEYADQITLGRSILHRIPLEQSLKM